MFKRITIFLYGVISYAVFFATFLYAIGFIGNFGVPTTLDGVPTRPLLPSLLIDLGLLALFALQHSIMARPAFKRWFTRVIPQTAERSTYVLASSLALIAMFYAWQPLGGVMWNVTDGVARGAIWGAYAFGWVLVLVATFLINHFDLFGLRQVWLQLTGKPYTQLAFNTPSLYKLVRHPLYVGWLFVFWSTPLMSLSHLVFAVMTTAYILVAIQFEERDLLAAHPEYKDYRSRVPMLLPLGRKRSRSGSFVRPHSHY